jgi:IS30 family transposase
MIGERPTVVDQRTRIGDWEADTIHGQGKAVLLSLVERKTGLVRLLKLPRATASYATEGMVKLLQTEVHKVLTITSDNGSEFHMYKEVEQQLDLQFYFATPHHAWERGTNENTNGLVRQYFRKRCNLSNVSETKCRAIAEILNNRPRKRLNWLTPNEVYYSTAS